MKIAITGHTGGIGKEFAEQLSQRGHTIVGISRREGENIRRTERCTRLIEPCDLFINNAQSTYAQTELLYSVWTRWQGQKKYIWNISTMMTERPTNSTPDGQNDITMSQYRNQKIALEEASKQLRVKSIWPKISIIRPGGVATQQTFDNSNKIDTKEWVNEILSLLSKPNIYISEISLGKGNSDFSL